MRYLKLASAKNPDNDYIELNDFNGFLCTSFQSLGISRKLEFLSVNNRQFTVSNKPNFKKYSLTIEILSKYSEYEAKHRELITFLDRNKKDGFRLYYRPYDGMELRYCLCDIETSVKGGKLQPVVLTLSQSSLWFGEQKKGTTSQIQQDNESENLFGFIDDGSGYYSASFKEDEEIEKYYCVAFFNSIYTETKIINESYNEIPLRIRIYGRCINPIVTLFKKDEGKPIREFSVSATINNGYLEVDASIENNGVWYVNPATGQKDDYTRYINYGIGSPYFYIEHGEYTIKIEDAGKNPCVADVFYQEEYSE